MKKIFGAIILTAIPLLGAPPANATPAPGHPNCDIAAWGFLGTQTRILCDEPIRADGSWMRRRVEYIPAHNIPATSSCYGGGYYSSYCSYYPGGWVDDVIKDDETYPVTPDTILPDEPGHLG